MIGKTLVFNGFEIDVKLENLRNSNNRVSAIKKCLKCNGLLKFKMYCENCGLNPQFKSILIDKNNNIIDINKVKANMINPQYILTLKPQRLNEFSEVYKKPLIDHTVYNILPAKDNEVPFSYLLSYLRHFNLVLPIDKFRYNKASFERQGYIEAYKDYLLLHLLLLPSEFKEIEAPKLEKVEKVDLFKQFLSNTAVTIMTTDKIQELGLIKEKKKKPSKKDKNKQFIELITPKLKLVAK